MHFRALTRIDEHKRDKFSISDYPVAHHNISDRQHRLHGIERRQTGIYLTNGCRPNISLFVDGKIVRLLKNARLI